MTGSLRKLEEYEKTVAEGKYESVNAYTRLLIEAMKQNRKLLEQYSYDAGPLQ